MKLSQIPRIHINCLLLLTLLVLATGCEKRDEIPPSVHLAAPLDNSTYVSGTEVRIVGSASDNKQVSSVGAIIQRISDGLMAGSGWGVPESDGSFDFKMEMGDRYTATGHYILRVTAYDEAGNPGSDFVEVFLTELPRTFYGAYLAEVDASGSATLNYLDTLGQLSNGPFIGQSLAVFKSDNRYQSILAGTYDGPLRAYHHDDLSELFALNAPQGYDPIPLRDLAIYNRQLFYGSGNQPYIQRYNNAGLSGPAFDQALFAPTSLLADSLGLFAVLSSADATVNKIDRYDRDNTGLEASDNLPWKGEFLAEAGDDQVVVGANQGGSGKLRFYDKNSLQLMDSMNLAEDILALDGLDGRLFVLGPGGPFEIDVFSHTPSSLIAVGAYTSFAYEPVQQYLYLGKANGLEVRSLNGSLISDVPVGNAVKEIEFHYNK